MDLLESRIRNLFAGVSSGYDTHRPVLCEAVLRTSGPILELGVGEGSTPPLHSVATECTRPVFSFDTNSQWIEKFLNLRSAHHFIAQVPSWDDCPVDSCFWSIAFIDHAPAQRRAVEVSRLAYKAELLVVHDTNEPEYGYGPLLDSFKYRFEYREYQQWTTVASNYVDVSGWRVSQ